MVNQLENDNNCAETEELLKVSELGSEKSRAMYLKYVSSSDVCNELEKGDPKRGVCPAKE